MPPTYTYRGKRYTLTQMRSDPAKRSRLSTARLTSDQQKERRRIATVTRDDANPLYDPSQLLTGHTLKVAADRMTGAELDPQLKALQRENDNALTQGNALSGNAMSYYRQLAGEEAGNYDRQRSITDRLRAALQQTTDTSDQAVKQAADDTHRSEDGVLAQRGISAGADGRADAEAVAARARVQATGQSASTAAAESGANYERNADMVRRISGLRGGELQGRLAIQLANQLGEGRAQIADKEGTRGGLFAKNLNDLGNSRLENALAAKELGLKESAATASATEKLAAAKAKDDEVNEWGYSKAEWRKLSPAKRQQIMADVKASQRAPDKPAAPKDHYGYSDAEWPNLTLEQKREAKRLWSSSGGNGDGKESQAAINLRRRVTNMGRTADDIQRRHPDLNIAPDAPKAQRDTIRRRLAAQLQRQAQQANPPYYIPADELSAALDIAVDGHVSRANLNTLEANRVDTSTLPRARPRKR